jgi:hypothetical protein
VVITGRDACVAVVGNADPVLPWEHAASNAAIDRAAYGNARRLRRVNIEIASARKNGG